MRYTKLTGESVFPMVSGEVLQYIVEGQKLKAIKALMHVQGTYYDAESKQDHSVMGLRDAKLIVEEIADTMFPSVQTTCEHCYGRGVIEVPNAAHPFNRS